MNLMFSSYIYPLAIKNKKYAYTVLHVLLSHELDVFLSYLPTCDKKLKRCIYRYEKYWLDLPNISDPIYPFLHIFMLDIGNSDYGFSEGCHDHNIF